MTKRTDCFEVTVRLRIPVNVVDTRTWDSALKALERAPDNLPAGSVMDIVRQPHFGKMAVPEIKSAEVVQLKPATVEPEIPASLVR